VFLLTSSPDSLSDLQAHARAVGVVYPTYYECAVPGGALTGSVVPAAAAYLKAARLAVMPRFYCADGATVHRILSDPRLRAATLAELVAIGEEPANRGICLDLENDGAPDRSAMSSFVAQLASRLHARRRRLSVVVVGVSGETPGASTSFYDDRAISASADSVFVLAWGTHWAGSGPGPIAPFSYVTGVVRYVASLPEASRFVVGAPMYGLDWSGAGEAIAYQYSEVSALVRSLGVTPMRDPASDELTFSYLADGVEHQVWYMDARATAHVLEIARAKHLAVGLWRLGSEDQRIWSSPTVLG